MELYFIDYRKSRFTVSSCFFRPQVEGSFVFKLWIIVEFNEKLKLRGGKENANKKLPLGNEKLSYLCACDVFSLIVCLGILAWIILKSKCVWIHVRDVALSNIFQNFGIFTGSIS